MNPSFPMQGPGVVNNSTNPLINDSHLPAPSHAINSQWAALNTNPDLQRTLCKAAAAGHLTQEQLQSFGAYMKNSASTYTMFQLELQAVQQQQITQQQQQQQQQQQHQHLDHDKPPPSQLSHQMSNISNSFVNSTLPSSQAPIQISPPSNHFQATHQSSMSPPPGVPQRITDPISLMNSDPHLTQSIAQLRQIQDVLKNPNLPPSERESATLRGRELRDAVASRMNLLGLRQTNSNSSSSPSVGGSQTFQPAGQASQPQHPNEALRAQLSAVYQRQQQMMSGMPLAAQSPNNLARSQAGNLSSVAASSPRNLNISGRDSPAPNSINTPSAMPNISRPGSSHQSAVGPASSPPPITNSASPPNNSNAELSKRRVQPRAQATKKSTQAIGTPKSASGSPFNPPTNPAISPRTVSTALPDATSAQPVQNSSVSGTNTAKGQQATSESLIETPSPAKESLQQLTTPSNKISSTPATRPDPLTQATSAGTPKNNKLAGPSVVPSAVSQQHNAIAAQQATSQITTGSTAPHPAPASSNNPAPAAPPAREPSQLQPTSPDPVPFPAPRPTATGGHAAPRTLAGPLVNRPPTNGISDALGQSNANSDSSGRGQEATSSNRIVSKRKIQELVESIDPSERLEAVVEDLLLELADEFIDSVTRFSCQLAKHRKSDRLETKDIQLHLERSWNIRIPGFANEEIRQSQSRRINALPSYQARVSAVREAAKKRRPAN